MTALADDPELEAHVRARVGTTLRGKYSVDAVLGIGGMAAVYSATHRNGRRVAVKLLHPALSMNAEARVRFSREGLVANTVRHPGVVVIIDDDVTEDGAAFLVMELLEGATLEDLWERHGHTLPLPAVTAAGVGVLDILAAAHAAGVVHRDIKPANLFLTNGWQIKVLDFGISRLDSIQSPSSTQTGMALGSPAFMAPEQALGRTLEIDGRTDVWATSAALFTLASGAYVHEGQSGQEMLIRAATTPARSLSTALPGVPGLISAVIDRGLAFRREDRWGSAAEMAVALAEASRATFGEEPSVGAFAPVLQFVPPTTSGTPMPPMRVSSIPPPNLATQLTSTTSGSMRPGPMLLAQRKRVLLIAAVAALGVLVGFIVVLSRLSSGSRANDATAGIVQQTPAAGGSVRSSAVATDVPAPPPVATEPETVSVEALTPTPTKAGAASRPNPPPRQGSTRAVTPATSTVARQPSSFLPPPPPVDPCDPPYRFDFFGHKVQKPGCPQSP